MLCYQVIAYTMALVLDGVYQPLMSIDIFERALHSLKLGKAADNIGMTAEGLKYMSQIARERMLDLFNERANCTDLSALKSDSKDPWWTIPAKLMAKTQVRCNIDNFRPIHILYIAQKLYMKCLLILYQTYCVIDGMLEFGGRKGHQAIELVALIRLIIEKR